MSEEGKEEEMEKRKKLGLKTLSLNPFAEEFKPSNVPVEAVMRVCSTTNNQELDSLGREDITFLRRRFDCNINRWVKVQLPPFPVILEGFSHHTSLMIRNIPNRLSRKMLIQLLDEHCKELNKCILGHNIHPPTPLSEYDFVYLPIDFKTSLNKGYAFVNFTTSAGAFRFFRSYDTRKWDYFQTKKTCEIDFAQIQGREKLVKHFMKSIFVCDTKDYLPVQFLPPRNGLYHTTTNGTTVGRRGAPHR